ncbi:SRPBCC family protein [Rhodococcus sp. HM1]|uniref:SRPBCC family protein n=1 Tax=unclassified Rhodococcus (in: high G+C Gram-positive bacteria) TaxID=192944 RepID=UPI0018CD299F|nr:MULTISPECIES: SRPBCC family protein [unclassified Rhodococcus (in: high G+C Gram-positive bacteria)]MBH0122946.1 SRPBCC family protein [Rhodococcus sp. CX]MCK8670917.1 SRPBCC family protein [Rhodococcus sp. HM1]
MASVTREITIAADADRAWQVLGDFIDGPTRMAPGFVRDSVLSEPGVRTVTFVDGTVMREREITVDDAGRRLVYAIVGGTAPPEHDNASVQVFPLPDGRCTVTWTHDVLPAGFAPAWGPNMELVLELFRKTMEGTQDIST